MKIKGAVQFIIGIAVLGLCAQASAQVRLGHPDRDWDRDRRDGGYASERLIEYVDRDVTDETLPLGRMLGLGRGYRGYAVQQVIVQVRGNRPGTQAILYGDSRVLNRQILVGPIATLYPYQGFVIGDNGRTLQLGIEGSAYVESITVLLEHTGRGGHPPRPPYPEPPYPEPPHTDIILERDVYHRVEGFHQVTSLRRLLNVTQDYRGYEVDRVVVRMRSHHGRGHASPGHAQLLVSGHPVGPSRLVDEYTREYEFELRGQNVSGEDLRHLQLETIGRFTIEYVAAILSPQDSRGYPDRGGRRDRGRGGRR